MTQGPAGMAGFGQGREVARRALIALVGVTAFWCGPAPAQEESIPEAVRRMEQTLGEMDLRLREMEQGSREVSRRLQALEGAVAAAGQGPVGEDRRVGDLFRDCDGTWCPEMVVVPAGEYRMGSPSGEAGRDDDEGPRHRVEIRESFAVGVYEVTRGQFAAFVGATDHDAGKSCLTYEGGSWEWREGRSWRNPGFDQTDGHPVVCVSWEDAQAYVDWLGEKTGEEYRLLSESEWEYVARAGTQTRYGWGDEVGSERANCDGCGSRWDNRQTAPVGQFEANRFGLHDVHGNVWEWVEDCWNGSYAGAPADGSAWRSGNCDRRVLRGGSWGGIPGFLRAANRNGLVTGIRNGNFGFRIARTQD